MSHVALRPYLAGLTCAGDVTDREVSQSLSVGWHRGTLNLKVFGPGFNSTFPWFITSSLSTPHLPVFVMNTSCLIIRLPFHANWWMFPRSKLCGSTIISWALEEPLQENSLTVSGAISLVYSRSGEALYESNGVTAIGNGLVLFSLSLSLTLFLLTELILVTSVHIKMAATNAC